MTSLSLPLPYASGAVMSEDLNQIIRKVAHLARLDLPEKDLKKYIDRAKAILGYVEKLNRIDTSNVEATSHALETPSFLRKDSVTKFEGVQELLGQAPEMKKPFLSFPKVIE